MFNSDILSKTYAKLSSEIWHSKDYVSNKATSLKNSITDYFKDTVLMKNSLIAADKAKKSFSHAVNYLEATKLGVAFKTKDYGTLINTTFKILLLMSVGNLALQAAYKYSSSPQDLAHKGQMKLKAESPHKNQKSQSPIATMPKPMVCNQKNLPHFLPKKISYIDKKFCIQMIQQDAADATSDELDNIIFGGKRPDEKYLRTHIKEYDLFRRRFYKAIPPQKIIDHIKMHGLTYEIYFIDSHYKYFLDNINKFDKYLIQFMIENEQLSVVIKYNLYLVDNENILGLLKKFGFDYLIHLKDSQLNYLKTNVGDEFENLLKDYLAKLDNKKIDNVLKKIGYEYSVYLNEKQLKYLMNNLPIADIDNLLDGKNEESIAECLNFVGTERLLAILNRSNPKVDIENCLSENHLAELAKNPTLVSSKTIENIIRFFATKPTNKSVLKSVGVLYNSYPFLENKFFSFNSYVNSISHQINRGILTQSRLPSILFAYRTPPHEEQLKIVDELISSQGKSFEKLNDNDKINLIHGIHKLDSQLIQKIKKSYPKEFEHFIKNYLPKVEKKYIRSDNEAASNWFSFTYKKPETRYANKVLSLIGYENALYLSDHQLDKLASEMKTTTFAKLLKLKKWDHNIINRLKPATLLSLIDKDPDFLIDHLSYDLRLKLANWYMYLKPETINAISGKIIGSLSGPQILAMILYSDGKCFKFASEEQIAYVKNAFRSHLLPFKLYLKFLENIPEGS